MQGAIAYKCSALPLPLPLPLPKAVYGLGVNYVRVTDTKPVVSATEM